MYATELRNQKRNTCEIVKVLLGEQEGKDERTTEKKKGQHMGGF